MKRIGSILAVLAVLSGPAAATQPDERLSDPALEAQARSIAKDLRCLVCQNQSIDDSDAALARDLRLLVRQRLLAGDDEEAVKRYIVDRYGDYVLMTPPFKSATLLLWLGPVLILAGAAGGVILFFRRRRAAAPAALLDARERQRLALLLRKENEPKDPSP